MKKICLALFVCFTSALLFAQDVKLKNNIVYVDGKECLKYSDPDASSAVISSLDGEDLIVLKDSRTYGFLYSKIIFVKQKKSLTSKSYIFTKKLLLKKLLESKTINDCKIDESKLDVFIMSFNEPVEK